MQSLRLSEQPAAPSVARTKESSLLPVKRPDRGGTLAIQRPNLLVNHFPVQFNAKTVITHYDVDIKLEDPLKKRRSSKIHKSHLRMIKDKLFSDDPSQFPLSSTAYDGEKNIFSAVELPTGTFKVEFAIAEDVNNCSYSVTIKEVNKLHLGKLKDYLSGDVLSIPRDILQGMDLVMKENPSRHRIPVGRSFYPKTFNRRDDLDGGITASKGFQQSLKPTSQGLAMCLDYSVLAFHKRLPVLDFLKEYGQFKEVSDVNKYRENVINTLKGLKVTVTHRLTKQKYTVAGLTAPTRDLSFEVEDPDGEDPPKKTTVVDYFQEKYGKEIMHKDIPCLDLGKNDRPNYVPMEFCVLAEGQRYSKEDLSREGSALLKNMSLVPPKDRMSTIYEMVRANDGPCGGVIAENFGIQVIKNMTKVQGRVIEPPSLKLGNMEEVRPGNNEKRQWNLVKSSVVEGKPLERWALIDFSKGDRGQLNGNRFVPNLINRCVKLGVHAEEPLVYELTTMRPFSNINELRRLLQSVVAKAKRENQGRLQMIVCVMARVDPGYKCLKWLSETEIGIVTQCCLCKHANEGKDQYLANLCLKINAKLGGSNYELSKPLPRFQGEAHVMFVGADVNHPAARNTTSPSIAAVVATVNWPAANRYAARVCAQYHRTEKILNFGTMVLELIQTYERINKVKPQRIVVFRDGVSEGQFDMVLNEELFDLKRAIDAEGYRPTITLVVAQKRHQTRLFPETKNDGGSNGNVQPGTVVDTVITHPFEFDFYLCSHYGSLGTSKPTHYYVLWDEHRFTSDQLQRLIYELCFTFARCTKPVSLVPPVYYADLAAYRGRMFQEAMELSLGSAASPSSSSSTSLSSVSSFGDRFCKLHPELENVMFFV
jgi:eukaryotic translation initiation factor 2C